MKKIYTFALLSAITVAVNAQDAFDAANVMTSDLNGTARFVGMGGALGALGGDLSVMGTNPAGTAIYRKSDFNISASGLSASEHALGNEKTRVSLDNLGVVFAFPFDDSGVGLQYVNFGVNYSKRRNHHGNLNTSVSGLDNKFSQGCQIANMANLALEADNWGILPDLGVESSRHPGFLFTDYVKPDDPKSEIYGYHSSPAQSAQYSRSTYGGTSETDINISFNVSDRFFWGVSVGVYGFDANRESYYMEKYADGYRYSLSNWDNTSGDGVDFKLGFICRPIEDSPFRFGITAHTPIWYKMTDSNGCTAQYGDDPKQTWYINSSDFDYDFRTPWSFGLSLGHTIGNNIAIGAEYEYTDMSSAKYSAVGGEGVNHFRSMNSAIQTILKSQQTFKLGVEYKPVKDFSVRLGYNHVTSPYQMDAYKDVAYYSNDSETDWTNWRAINRYCVGLGYRFSGCYVDVAYQYQTQKGDFYAFNDGDPSIGYLPATQIKNNRSQILASFGIKF